MASIQRNKGNTCTNKNPYGQCLQGKKQVVETKTGKSRKKSIQAIQHIFFLFFLFNLQLTFGSQPVIRDWLVAPLVMVTNKFGEVMQNLIDAGHDDAPTGVVGEFIKMTLCIKMAGRH